MNTVEARSVAAWRAWLADNGRSQREVWLVLTTKDGGLSYNEAIEQALCYG